MEKPFRPLVIVSVAGDSCVLSSALDPHIRDFPAWASTDAAALMTGNWNTRAMPFMAESIGCDTTPIDSLPDQI
jgi:hypothetical protein